MRKPACLLLFLGLAAVCGSTAAAAAQIQVTFGKEIRRLQDFVDRRYGKNRINVKSDFIGARAGDIDPWFWVGDRIGAVRVRMLKRAPNQDVLGWYVENGAQPILPEGGGVLFAGRPRAREEAVVTLPGIRTRLGFYIEPEESGNADAGNRPAGDHGRRLFTNRLLNDCGPDGEGAVHPPFDGDVQALIYDVSRWAGRDTWLVCFEDGDSGGMPGGDDRVVESLAGPDEDDADDGRGRSPAPDNAFDDVIFEVRADGATLGRAMSFGALKLRYR